MHVICSECGRELGFRIVDVKNSGGEIVIELSVEACMDCIDQITHTVYQEAFDESFEEGYADGLDAG